jgi:hypothetical protein
MTPPMSRSVSGSAGSLTNVFRTGLKFRMNAIAWAVVVLALVAHRAWVFVLGALSIGGPSHVSIAISHSSSGFLGFVRAATTVDLLVIVVAELAAVVFASTDAVAAVGGDPQ